MKRIVVIQPMASFAGNQTKIPVFHIGNISLEIAFWKGGVEIKSIIYKKERALYNISDFKNADDFITLKEFIFEIYCQKNTYNPPKFVVKNLTKRITDCLGTDRIWIKKWIN